MEDKQLNFKVASMPHADKFQLHIYAALAEQERDFISLRTKAALAEKKASGAVLGGLRDNTNRRNVIKKHQADQAAPKFWPLIQPMLDKGVSLRSIAKRLNETGLTTSTGASFNSQTINQEYKNQVFTQPGFVVVHIIQEHSQPDLPDLQP